MPKSDQTQSEEHPLIQILKTYFLCLVPRGFRAVYDTETFKNICMALLFTAIALFFLLFFSIESLIKGDIIHGISLLFLLFLTSGGYIIMRHTGKINLFINYIVFLMGVLNLYLLCTGGIDGTGPLWFFIFPPMALFLQGPKKGIISVIILLVLTIPILLWPSFPLLEYTYSSVFILRFLAALVTVTLMALIYEYSRKKSQQELITLSQKLDETSRTDDLTGLSNRRDMNERLEQEISRYQRNKKSFSVIMGDIDHFKRVNDTYGHECGDLLLQQIAGILKDTVRKQDTVSRWGGEEFLILLPETSTQRANDIAERLKQKVQEGQFTYNGTRLVTTMSFGTHTFDDSHDLNSLLSHTDEYLYHSKRTGRNRVTSQLG